MKITKIEYCKTFNLGNYQSEKIGFEAELEEGEDRDEALNQLRNMAQQNFEANNPQIVWEKKGGLPLPSDFLKTSEVIAVNNEEKEFPILPKQSSKESKREKFILAMAKEIEAATSSQMLNGYRTVTKTYPELKEAFDAKMKQFNEQEVAS